MWFAVSFCSVSLGCFFVCLGESVSYLALWCMVELLSVGLIPYFFLSLSPSSQRSLLQFVVISGISSLFLVAGAFVGPYQSIFIGVGVMVKLGVFPFTSWVYEVIVNSNWVVIWVFSGLLKVPFLFILYMLGPGSFPFNVFCAMCFLLLGINLWKTSGGWRRCWGHMMISGSVSLVIISVTCSANLVYYVYWIYFVWSSLSVVFFIFVSSKGCVLSDFYIFLFVVLFVSFPCSLAVFYKYAIGISLLSSSLGVFVSWCFYTVSEQVFVLYYLISRSGSRGFVDLFSSI